MPLRWGIISAGKIANDWVNAFNTFPDIGDQVIVAVADREKAVAEEFAKVHKIGKVFDDYQAMAKSDIIDVVYIAFLNIDHYKVAKYFLENGKHVLCEKPLCMNSKQTISLTNIAKKNNRFLMEAIWSRFSPVYQAVRKDIEDGKLGEVKRVDVTHGVVLEHVERVSKKELGGSATMDIGIYTLQLAQFIFKEEPIKITAVGKLNDSGVDSVATMILEYTGNRRAVLNIDTTVAVSCKARVAGTKGRITLGAPYNFPIELRRVDGTLDHFPLHPSDKPYCYPNSAGLVYESLEVARCIKNGLLESPVLPHKESIILAKLEENVRKQLGVFYDADFEEYP